MIWPFLPPLPVSHDPRSKSWIISGDDGRAIIETFSEAQASQALAWGFIVETGADYLPRINRRFKS